MATIDDLLKSSEKLDELQKEHAALSERFERLTAEASKAETRLAAIERELDALLTDVKDKADEAIRGRGRGRP